ncbi:L-type lectin-domain containing receptor kinase IV.3 [Sesamum alatum]|uniref:L-type lectin-domain containing receptor kinase IV.3 n=1 Tax=Sesamum alatum TaxID=300844 RepID=A0AAE1Z2P4_9LAMI|nr:L-type lectin-domain containing receptor kinase IV.3 [Sesamum alatum]
MASISANSLHFLTALLYISIPVIFTATVVDDLNNLQPPPDFKSTITNNCRRNPSLRYCNSTPSDLHQIFKSTIVASHLCNISGNPNCVESFPKIDLHAQPKIAPLYLSFTFFWKYCPLTILSIDLSNNSLTGDFPTDVFYCSQIQALDLSHNDLSGDLPIQNFSLLENLTFLNLSYNDFTECRISDTHFFERFNSSSFIRSGLVPNHKEFRIKAVLLLVGLPVLVLVMVVFWGWLCFLQIRNERKFRPSMLKVATDGFSARNLMMKNGRASAYRGVLRDGSEVRVEIYLDAMSRENRRRFVEQCKILVQLQHKNIVPVLGWCGGRRLRAVVTEWIDGENIETLLSSCNPPWKQRVQVILGIAAGICYLHQEWPQVGYNLKTRNIMLSADGEPLITRFKLLDDHHSSTKKTYEFGMFMLEIVTNRRGSKELDQKSVDIVEWVKSNYPDNVENVIDKRMKKTVEIVSEAAEVLEFGLTCIDASNSHQPSWDRICDLLSDISSTAIPSASPDHWTSRVQRGGGRKHVHHRGVQ